MTPTSQSQSTCSFQTLLCRKPHLDTANTMTRKRGAASSELGVDDFAPDYSPKGRAIRKCRSRKAHPVPDFEDSSDADDDNDEIIVAPMRKKKKRARSISPTRDISSENQEDAELSSDDKVTEIQDQNQGPAGHLTVHLTVNIPLNHQGPITLTLDPKNFAASPAPDKLSNTTLARLNARSKPKLKTAAGFLALPAELKNSIYREVFVANKPLRFGTPGTAFSRTSALLRTCRQVYVRISLYLSPQPMSQIFYDASPSRCMTDRLVGRRTKHSIL